MTTLSIDPRSIYDTGWKVPIADPTGWENVVGPTPFQTRIRALLVSFWSRDSTRTAVVTTPVPEVQRHVVEILRWTGWSNRELAQTLSTTHPTIGGLVSGRSVDLTRRPELRQSIDDLHALCRRLVPLVGEAPGAVSRLLKMSVDDEKVVDIALEGDLPRAYLTALRALVPSERDHYMSASIFPKVPGTATTALHD
jgi:hypothetical protein